ncbi:MAG: DNA polymerase III subunit gamma/tau [Clostridia bacterium]|nr:DNA polymerase III subunit gamma/tau [Clostridia bacterium]
MEYLALYRRYRPNTFDKLIGQEHIVSTLVNQIENQRLGHAYLFTGTRGTGKTSCAKIFAKAINCENPVNGSPCEKCATCRSLSQASNMDVIEIDAASNNGVNEIRELKENVQYPPVSCKYKVYIIDEVHMLTGQAFNALLKTLEEPPKHAVFILATTEVHKIPATILSRCMRFDFRLIPVNEITSLIASIYDEQGKSYEKEAITAIAKAGEGSIRDALSIADIALSYSNEKLTYQDVMTILGAFNTEVLYEFIQTIFLGKVGGVLEIIDKLCSLGRSVGVLIKDVVSLLRDLLIIKTCNNAREILSIPEDKFNALKTISDLAVEEKILRTMEIFSEAESSLKYSNHPRVVFEWASVKATRPETDYSIDALLSRIKTLEEKIEKGEFTVKEEKIQKFTETKEEIKIPTVPKDEEKKVEKIALSSLDGEMVKARILSFLRKSGSELLWNIMQTVIVSIKNNTLVLTPTSSTDGELLIKIGNQEKIKNALGDVLDFEIEVEEYKKEKLLSEVDDATERIKKIFGEDIVIIKK